MAKKLRHGSLFTGVGGMDLGLDWAGFETVWQVEIDPFARKVLKKHWPSVPKFTDVRECGRHNLQPVDIITGGYPCQDHSIAGKKQGLGTADSAGSLLRTSLASCIQQTGTQCSPGWRKSATPGGRAFWTPERSEPR